MQASESYKANLLKSKTADSDSSAGVETHTDGVTSLMVAAVGGHMVGAAASISTVSMHTVLTDACCVVCCVTKGQAWL